MTRPVDVIVTGFVKSPVILERSLAPLRRIKHEGIVRSIHCVTWSSPELDEYVEPVKSIHGVELTRVPQPEIDGGPNVRGVTYQVKNLEIGLGLLPAEDGLVLKWRPDFVAKHAFLRQKIAGFDVSNAVPDNSWEGIAMPPRAFGQKLWIPWADSNSPFFYEDGVFLGRRRDVHKLVTPLSAADLDLLADPLCGSYAHVVRYGKVFAGRYPLFDRYFRFYRYFAHDLEYRRRVMPFALDNGFFWHLLVAHAWILHSQFHVDIGAPGELLFYANAVNRKTDWRRPESAVVTTPYDDSAEWRAGTGAGAAFPSVSRAYGRLMDDCWQNALFTRMLPDLPRATLAALMANVARCRDGRLGEIEAAFYRQMERLYSENRPVALAS